jgi:hypothetical protein
MIHHGMPLQHFSETTCKGQAWGAAKALFCWNLVEACEAREHGSDSKQKQSSGRINHASKRVDESTWAVQPRGARGHNATKEHGVHWRKIEPSGEAGHLGQSAQAGRPHPFLRPQCPSSSSKLLALFFVRVPELLVQNHHRLSLPLRDCFI